MPAQALPSIGHSLPAEASMADMQRQESTLAELVQTLTPEQQQSVEQVGVPAVHSCSINLVAARVRQ